MYESLQWAGALSVANINVAKRIQILVNIKSPLNSDMNIIYKVLSLNMDMNNICEEYAQKNWSIEIFATLKSIKMGRVCLRLGPVRSGLFWSVWVGWGAFGSVVVIFLCCT